MIYHGFPKSVLNILLCPKDEGELAVEQAEERGAQRGEERGQEKKEIQAVIGFYEINVTIENIAIALKITEEKVRQIIEDYRN